MIAGSICVVLGARGATSQCIISQLTERNAKEIRCVVRPESFQAYLDSLTGREWTVEEPPAKDDMEQRYAVCTHESHSTTLRAFAGDVTVVESLQDAFAGETAADHVFFGASGSGYDNVIAVDWLGVKATADLAKKLGVRRYVLVSSQLVHPDNRWNLIRGILNTIATGMFHYKGLMDFKFAGEQALRKSGVPYTIVRPGQLTDDAGMESIGLGQNNESFKNGGGVKCTRSDVATVCVMAAETVAAENCTFEMACATSASPVEADPKMFDGLKPEWDNDWEDQLDAQEYQPKVVYEGTCSC